MFYYVRTAGGKIIQSGSHTTKIVLPEGFIEVTQSIYNQIGSIPCAYTMQDHEISSVEYIAPVSEIKVSTDTERIAMLEDSVNFLLGL
jgi:hypothetical protein